MPTTRKLSVAFPEVATIRMGGPKVKKTNAQGKTYETVGPDLNDRFRVVFAPGAEALRDKFLAIYQTDQPHIIRAMLPFPRAAQAWEHYNEAYNAGRLIARADDDKFLVYRDPLSGEYEVRDGEPYKEFTPGMKIAYTRASDGKQIELAIKSTGRLKLWLPELERLVFLTLKTTSYYACMNISANLMAVQGIADALNGGNAAGIPLIVYRKEQEVCWNKPDGTAQRVKKWLAVVEVDPEFTATVMRRLSQLALTGSSAVAQLPAGAPVQPIDGFEDPALPEEPGEEEDVFDGATGQLVTETQPEPPPATSPAAATSEPEVVATLTGFDPDLVLAGARRGENGKILRPMAPQVVKAAIAKKATVFADKTTVSGKQIQLVRMLLESAFAGEEKPDAIRHTVTAYLTGVESLKEVPVPVFLAMLEWLNPQQADSGEYLLDAVSARELTSIWPAALESAGQPTLF